jgi:hypothetical protein
MPQKPRASAKSSGDWNRWGKHVPTAVCLDAENYKTVWCGISAVQEEGPDGRSSRRDIDVASFIVGQSFGSVSTLVDARGEKALVFLVEERCVLRSGDLECVV